MERPREGKEPSMFEKLKKWRKEEQGQKGPEVVEVCRNYRMMS